MNAVAAVADRGTGVNDPGDRSGRLRLIAPTSTLCIVEIPRSEPNWLIRWNDKRALTEARTHC